MAGPNKPARLALPGVPPREVPPVVNAPIAGLGRLRKIALIGSATTVNLAPWYDPTWEIWAHATVHPYCVRVDRYFDLHPWEWISTKPVPGYLNWLKSERTPIYMQRKFRDVPSSVRYPKERILAEFPRYITSHAGWMIALALTEGVTHLGFYGIHYALDEEHKKQRTGCEFWMGVAVGRGVQIVNPPGSPLLREPGWLYGYESHDGKTHKRAQTGGAKPQKGIDLSIPPQNRQITVMGGPSVKQSMAVGRTDIPFSAGAQERLRAQLEGRDPAPWALGQKESGHGTDQ
jgi:hypothetical protein